MRPVMRYHGAKYRLAPWIMSFFPEHNTYVEPFGGAAGVLLQKPRAYAEIYNDIDGDIVNVFRVLQNLTLADQLCRELVLTPFARAEFELAFEAVDDPVERARRTIIRASMGFGSAGATKTATGFRVDSQRQYGTAQRLWASYPPEIARFTERLRGVLIESQPALAVIDQHDAPDTLHYVDPPYLEQTRVGGNRYYRFEMTDSDHLELLQALKQLAGMVVLSGYDSELYHDTLSGWQCHKTSARIAAARGTGVRTECVWLNPVCQAGQPQASLFAFNS